VRSGALAAGEALPPVRRLAADLGVSPATVAAAYRALRLRGVIETAGRNGSRIRHRPPVAGQRGARLPATPAGVLDLAAGVADPALLPDLRPILARLPSAEPLRHLAAAALTDDGVDLTGGAIAVVGGALDGIERVLGAHLRPGDAVAVEDPGWANLLDLIAALGLHPHPVPVDAQGPTADGVAAALSAGVRAVVITSRAHNPTGACVSAGRAAELRDLLRRHPEVLVVEDDFAAQLASDPLHPVADAVPRWAFVRSVSKPYGSDLRLAVLAGDQETIARVEGRQRLGTGWVSTILQSAVVGLWTSPTADAVVADARRRYDLRRSGLIAALAGHGVGATGHSGLNVWIPVPDETLAVTRLREAGYAVAPGAMYRLATPPAIRITVSRLPEDGIERLAGAVARAVAPAVPIAGRA